MAKRATQTNDLFAALDKEVGTLKQVAEAARREKAVPLKKAAGAEAGSYSAADIEVLEGLEPVRRRPGMYIGGTDEKGLHHLFAEVIDNAMDEAVAGHATWIEVEVAADGFVTVTDNGRGIPVDPHPKFKTKSALEVIMTMLHSGGKFASKVYETSGGLHGVGVSVVNALSELLEVEVARGRKLYRQRFSRGAPLEKLKEIGEVHNRRGTRIRFKPDPEIFGKGAAFKPERLFAMTRSKAYLFGGVEIRWQCAPELLKDKASVPEKATLPLPRRTLRLSRGRARRGKDDRPDLCRPDREAERPRRGRMGDRLVSGRRVSPLLLQHDPDRRRRHARGRAALGADQGAEGLRRALRQQARRHDHRRRRDDVRGRASSPSSSASPNSSARPRTALPAPRRRASSRTRSAIPSTIGWRPRRARRPASSTG